MAVKLPRLLLKPTLASPLLSLVRPCSVQMLAVLVARAAAAVPAATATMRWRSQLPVGIPGLKMMNKQRLWQQRLQRLWQYRMQQQDTPEKNQTSRLSWASQMRLGQQRGRQRCR